MKQALFVSAAIAAANGQYLRRTGPIDLTPAIPEKPIRRIDLIPTNPEQPDYKIALEDVTTEDNEFTAIPERLRPAIPERPIDRILIDPRPTIPERPIIDLPIKIEPVGYTVEAIAADEELNIIPGRERPVIPERPILRFPNGTEYVIPIRPIDFPFNGTILNHTIHFPVNSTFNGTDFPIRRSILPIEYAIAADDELTAIPERLRPAIPERPIDRILIDPRPTIPERPIIDLPIRIDPIERSPILIDPRPTIPERPIIDLPIRIDPIERSPIPVEAIAADEELIAIPERLRPVIPERPIYRFPNGTEFTIPVTDLPFNGTILNHTIHFPVNFTLNGTDFPIRRSILPIEYAIAADDELNAIPERLRPAIPERPLDRIIIDPRPTIPEKPIKLPIRLETAIAADDELTAIPERLRPAIPERPLDRIIIDPRPTIPEKPIKLPIRLETAIAADDELTAIPERLRPAIPERPQYHLPANFTVKVDLPENFTLTPFIKILNDYPEHIVPIDYPEDAIAGF